MVIWQDVQRLGQKVLALTKTAENNTDRIESLEQNQVKLTKIIARLKQDLELERQKNQQQKALYQSEISRYKVELDNKLKKLEILLLRTKIDAQNSSTSNQSRQLEDEGEKEE